MITFDPETHTYRDHIGPVPGVTSVLALLNEYQYVARRVLADAANRGTAVHQATEELDAEELREGRTFDPDDLDRWGVDGYVAAWRRFLGETGFEIHDVERRVYSPRYRYAGTLDRTGVLNGHKAIVDIKTTSVISPMVGLQLAAYQRALNTELEPDAPFEVRGLAPYVRRYAVQLRRDGSYRLHEFSAAEDFSVFTSLLTIYNWTRNRKGAS